MRLILCPCTHWPYYLQLKLGWCVSLQSKKTCGDLYTLGVGVVAEAQNSVGGPRVSFALLNCQSDWNSHCQSKSLTSADLTTSVATTHSSPREHTPLGCLADQKSHCQAECLASAHCFPHSTPARTAERSNLRLICRRMTDYIQNDRFNMLYQKKQK